LTLLWGNEIANFDSPDYGIPGIDTPHPLSNAVGALLSFLGTDGADVGILAINYLSLAACGVLIFLVARTWFGSAAAVLAALLFLSRPSILASGVATYRDSVYLALVLGALLAELRRPHNGTVTLGLLAVAGLLRPEAWALSGLYVLYCAYADRDRFWRLTLLACVAPVLWLLSDLVVAGDPLHSFTYTQAFAEELERDTGLYDAVRLLPTRLVDLTSKVILAAGLVGATVSWIWLPRQTRTCVALLALSFAIFVCLATVGFSIVGRYLIVSTALICMLAGAGMLGWLQTPPGERRARLAWGAAGVAVALAVASFAPDWIRAIDQQRAEEVSQAEGRDDLESLVNSGTFKSSCGPISLPTLRQTANVARWTGRPHRSIKSIPAERPSSGYYVLPRTERLGQLLRQEMGKPISYQTPPAFVKVAENRSWSVYGRCRA
jgi:hypothetical protein